VILADRAPLAVAEVPPGHAIRPLVVETHFLGDLAFVGVSTLCHSSSGEVLNRGFIGPG
jgi:hypothetical protein